MMKATVTVSDQRLTVVAAVVTALAVGAMVGPGAAGTSAEPTAVRVFTPFPNGRLAPRLRIVKTVRGSCFFGSPAARRPDAWRCEPGLLDPCFENRTRRQRYVFCIPTPWSTDVTRIRLTRGFPANARNRNVAPARRQPWGIELETGERCTLVEGAPLRIRGRFYHYSCARGAARAGAAATMLNRTSATWTTFFVDDGSRSPRRVAIRAAWV